MKKYPFETRLSAGKTVDLLDNHVIKYNTFFFRYERRKERATSMLAWEKEIYKYCYVPKRKLPILTCFAALFGGYAGFLYFHKRIEKEFLWNQTVDPGSTVKQKYFLFLYTNILVFCYFFYGNCIQVSFIFTNCISLQI